MKCIRILVEGHTERAVTNAVIIPSLVRDDVDIQAATVITSRGGSAPAARGGVSRWSAIQRQIRAHLHDSSLTVLTTMFDFYGFPKDAPGISVAATLPSPDRARHLQEAMSDVIGDPRFVPFVVLHELEAWVLAGIQELGHLRGDPGAAKKVSGWIDGCGGHAEWVNDGPQTAPSKRLLALDPRYSKVVDGPEIIRAAGLEAVRRRCSHLDEWLSHLEGV